MESTAHLTTSDTLVFYVNGKKVRVERPDPAVTLLWFLRRKLHLKGVKSACQEGGCGSCTVMVSRYNRDKKKISHYAVVACITPLCGMHGLAVTTIEALGSNKTKLHPVQERLAICHGSQCGFCSPGMVMSMYTLLRNDHHPSKQDIEEALDGNLCRCTGYRPILAAFYSFSKESVCGLGENCCQNSESATCNLQKADVTGLDPSSQYLPYDPSQEPIFPPELQLSDEYDKQSLIFRGKQLSLHRPVNVIEALKLKEENAYAQFMGGSTANAATSTTENGVKQKINIILTSGIAELKYTRITESGLTVGSGLTLTEFMEEISSCSRNLPGTQTKYLKAFEELLRVYASKQIRNVATVGGSIADSTDFNTVIRATGAKIIYAGENEALIHGLEIAFSEEMECCQTYKVADRNHVGLSYVIATFRVKFKKNDNIIERFSACFAGRDQPLVATSFMHADIIGKKWDGALADEILSYMRKEVTDNWGMLSGSSLQYRLSLVLGLFFKFYIHVCQDLNINDDKLDISYIGSTSLLREPRCGTQVFEEVACTQSSNDAVGRPIVHQSALQQVTGEAVYIDDIPEYQNELHLCFVKSDYAHAEILDVDSSEAEEVPGVRAYISHKDVQGDNLTGVIFPDEEVFATQKVDFKGQIIGAVIADTPEIAARGAAAMKIRYREMTPILTIEEAIKAKSFMSPVSKHVAGVGDIETGFRESDVIVEGKVMCGPQEHMALDTLASICVPTGEKNEMIIYSNSQGPAQQQERISKVLGVPQNKLIIKVKRIGGGFGGKETRNIIVNCPSAVAAMKLNRPVRCVLKREEESTIKGTRHAALAKYRVGFKKDGVLQALDVDMYFNCGHSNDISTAVVHMAVMKFVNAYKIPNFRITGHLCRTNLHSATSFRGFGTPQSVFVMENIISHVASELCMRKEEISLVNLLKEGDVTTYGIKVENCTIRRCWDECVVSSNYHTRLQDVLLFNSNNRLRKRGIAVTPIQFPLFYGEKTLNQGGALVNIYTDGSVMISHGGVEMGQGLHTKMIQIASRVLDIPADSIHIMDTSTDRVPNTSNTSASLGSDLYGPAVMNACEILKERLTPYKQADPNGSWEDWVCAAFNDQVPLSATGFFKNNCDSFDWETFKGTPYWYSSYGAACSEVELDCLTGEHVVMRTDIVMDVGRSLNPAIDIGQIEGGFLQGYGYLTMEEVRYSEKGEVLTRGPNSYKIPAVCNVPIKMNVTLLKGSDNLKAVYSSKGIGEPPYLLANSVYSAIRDAVTASRLEVGITDHFRLDAPATADKVRPLCRDRFTDTFLNNPK